VSCFAQGAGRGSVSVTMALVVQLKGMNQVPRPAIRDLSLVGMLAFGAINPKNHEMKEIRHSGLDPDSLGRRILGVGASGLLVLFKT